LKAIELPGKILPIPTRPIFYDILYILVNNIVNQRYNILHWIIKCKKVGLVNYLKDDYVIINLWIFIKNCIYLLPYNLKIFVKYILNLLSMLYFTIFCTKQYEKLVLMIKIWFSYNIFISYMDI
jgi:hypothetical protein